MNWGKLLLWVWQLPQNLLGLVVVWVTRAKRAEGIFGYGDIYVISNRSFRFWVSLGEYIILRPSCGLDTIKHEKGHQVQSRWLGPLYLLVVGLPSAVFCNLWDRVFHKGWYTDRRVAWYHSRWPEGPGGHWWDRFTADVLGGVVKG
jgi:hypothetical protein